MSTTNASIDSLMLLSNACVADPRVRKEARSLAAAGYRVRVLAWDRDAIHPPFSQEDGFTVERFARKSTSGTGFRQFGGMARFWAWCIRRGVALAPRLVHCHDLDMFPAAEVISILARAPIVYDSHELYAEMQRRRMPGPLVALLRAYEAHAVCSSNRTIVVAPYAREYFGSLAARTDIVGNWYETAGPQPQLRKEVREKLGVPQDAFVITFVGNLSETRNFEPLIGALDLDENLYAIVAGKGYHENRIAEAAARQPRLRYIGFTKTPGPYFAACDASYYLHRDLDGYGRFVSCNCFGWSIAYHKPMMTAPTGDTGSIVASLSPELTFRDATAQDVIRVVNYLRDGANRARVDDRIVAAVADQCSWGAASKRLLAVYRDLIGAGAPA